MRVKDIMSAPVYAITPGDPISRARNLMLRHKISRLLVTLHGDPVGVLTKADIGRRLDQAEPQWRRRPIDQIPVQLVMTKSLISIYPDATLPQTCELLLENGIGGLAVRDEELYGVVTKWDLIKHFAQTSTDLPVSEIMSDFVAVVHRRHSISHILQLMESEDVDRVVVLEYGEQPIGMITNSNLTFACMSGAETGSRKMFELPILAEDIMSAPLTTIQKDGLAIDAAQMMVKEQITSIVVVDEDMYLAGILNQECMLQAIIMTGE